MSGVAKDESPSGAPAEEAATVVPAPVQDEPAQTAADISVDPAPVREGDTVVKLNLDKNARKTHLRVVADNEAAHPAPAAEGPAQRIGASLRQARETLGYDLEQVSKETRITVSHLRAIEDMTPNLIGEPVYVKGHVRTYARHLKLDADAVLERYLKECAILTDPRKQEIAPPKVERRMPVAVPVLGVLIVALAVGAGGYAILSNAGEKPAPAASASALPSASSSASASPSAVASAGPEVAANDTLRIVTLRRARLEVRGANGDIFRARYFSPGESYAPRVGAGWTVTTPDGSAFEWRRGDVSLGLVAPEGPVYAQSVDAALSREPIVSDSPDPSAPVLSPSPTISGGLPDANAPLAPGAVKPGMIAPKPAGAPKPVVSATAPKPRPAAPVSPSASAAPAAPPAQPSKDPALDAYPDQ